MFAGRHGLVSPRGSRQFGVFAPDAWFDSRLEGFIQCNIDHERGGIGS